MNKRFLTTAAAILLVGASAFSALTFTGCSCTGKGNKTQTTTAASAVQAKTYETKDLLTCESWIGKLTNQVGMESYTANNQIEVKGQLFGTAATGVATVQKGGDVISSVKLTAGALAYIKDEGTTCSFRTGSNTAVLTQSGDGVTLEFK